LRRAPNPLHLGCEDPVAGSTGDSWMVGRAAQPAIGDAAGLCSLFCRNDTQQSAFWVLVGAYLLWSAVHYPSCAFGFDCGCLRRNPDRQLFCLLGYGGQLPHRSCRHPLAISHHPRRPWFNACCSARAQILAYALGNCATDRVRPRPASWQNPTKWTATGGHREKRIS
jgi:hypothetical protein